MRRVSKSVIVAAFLTTWIAAAMAADRFVAGVADLPLMPGLEEIADAGLVFDKPDGRIVEAYAVGDVDAAAVVAFYADTLPQLGWQAAGATRYQREDEILQIETSAADARLTVKFSIAPK